MKKLILRCKPCEYTAISQPFKPGKHKGIDLVNHKLYAKTPIRAAADGIVVCAGGKGHNWDWSYGKEVAIYHGNGWYTNYGHLSSIKVKVGQKVKASDVLGTMGTSGNSTGIHLHFEVHNGKWNRLNPKPFMDKAGVACKYKVITKTSKLIVRANPDPDAKIVGLMEKGSVIIGTTKSDNWIYIPSMGGWSAKTFLKKV